jgi:hypothetical protein
VISRGSIEAEWGVVITLGMCDRISIARTLFSRGLLAFIIVRKFWRSFNHSVSIVSLREAE